MAIEKRTLPYEILIRFGWQTFDELGTVKTYMVTDQEVVADPDASTILSRDVGKPADFDRDAAVKHLGEDMAGFLEQLTNERAASLQALADAKTASDAALAAKDATIADLTQQISDLNSVLGGTEAGQALLTTRKADTARAQLAAAAKAVSALGLDVAAETATVVSDLATANANPVEGARV